MPPWMWNCIAHCLGVVQYNQGQMKNGISRKPPPLAVALDIATIGSAILMLVFFVWFTGFNIASTHSKSDILDGVSQVAIISLYAALGVYAHRLAARLFVHPKFTDMTRLHSKTVAKLNAAMLVFAMMALFIVAVNWHLSNYMYLSVPEPPTSQNTTDTNSTKPAGLGSINIDDSDGINPCQTVKIPLWICQTYWLNQVVFSGFFLVWNGVVAMVLVSVSRTHTVSIRRVISLLDFDAYLIDRERRKKSKKTKGSDENLFHWILAEHGDSSEAISKLKKDRQESHQEDSSSSDKQQTSQPSECSLTEAQCQENAQEVLNDLEDIQEEPTFFTNDSSGGRSQGIALELHDESSQVSNASSSPVRLGRLGRAFSRFRKLSEDEDSPQRDNNQDTEDFVEEPHIMTSEEILSKHWKLVATTQLTSRAMQRWMCSMTLCILFYTTIQIVYWFSHPPTLTGVLSFICPLLILPLLASAYAEVNYEGQNLVQAIMPTDDRTHIFRYLYGMPVQLTVYGHPITFGTMSTVLAAIMAAFASKILIKSMTILE